MRILAPRVLVLALPATVLVAAAAWANEPTFGWSDFHDGGIGLPDQGTALLLHPDGDILVGGESTDSDGTSDLFVRKLSRDDGRELWAGRWSDPGGNDMALIELAFDPRGDIVVAGYIRGCVG